MSGKRKIGVKYNAQNELVNVDVNLGFQKILEDLKLQFKLPEEKNVGLKLTFHGLDKKQRNNYVVEDNFEIDFADGSLFELVDSLDDKIDFIFCDNYQGDRDKFQCLYDLCTDKAFIKKIVEKNYQSEVLDLLTTRHLDQKGRSGCLLTILNLLKGNHIDHIPQEVVRMILSIVKKNDILYGVPVLTQILYSKKVDLLSIKKNIIDFLPMEVLMSYIKINHNSKPECFQNAFNILSLINAIIRCVKNEKKEAIIMVLNMPPNREKVYKIIEHNQFTSEAQAQDLYILQTYLLSPYKNLLHRMISIEAIESNSSARNSSNFDDEFNMIAFEDNQTQKSTDNYSLYRDNVSRYSLASISTYTSSGDFIDNNNSVSQLTSTCIAHYRKTMYQNFAKSQSEENTYEPGICKSSDRVVKILAEALNIVGKPFKTKKSYIPLFFNGNTNCFFEEMYGRLMYLLSRNRKEMKVKTIDDYEKLLSVLEKQVEMMIDRKPMTWKDVTLWMDSISYKNIKEEWREERDKDFTNSLETNPCIIELMKRLEVDNRKLLREKTMNLLKKGGTFPKLTEKIDKKGTTKGRRYFMLVLSQNERFLYVGDCENFKMVGEKQTYHMDQLRHFVTGDACPLIKDNIIPHSQKNVAFSLLFPNEFVINCVAGDEKVASMWIDGFHMLTGKEDRSKIFMEELHELTKMDVALSLIELQNVKIPSEPPPIPPLVPTRISPMIPPKKRLSRMQSMVGGIDTENKNQKRQST